MNVKASLNHPAVETTAASYAATHKAPKKGAEKKAKAAAPTSTQKARTSKSRRLSSVQDDIQSTPRTSVGSEESSGPSSNGGLFGGDRQHWEPDPLTLFMFENASVIIELAMQSQEAMTKAQVTQTKLQSQNALQNAKDTIAKGQEQAKQQRMKAAGEFAQAGIAALQTGLMAKDFAVDQDAYTDDLENHENVVKALNKPIESETTTGGTALSEAEGAEGTATRDAGSLSVDEVKVIKAKAKEFKAARDTEYEKALETRKNSKKTWFKKSALGMDRSDNWVNGENEMLASREASATAYDQVLARPSTVEIRSESGEMVTKEFDPTKAFEEKDIKSSSSDAERDEIKAHNSRAREAHKVFMKELFGENPKVDESGNVILDEDGNRQFDGPPATARERMDLVGNWGNGTRMQEKMLRSYGGTEEGAKMKADFENPNGGPLRIASDKANLEMAKNRRVTERRQMVLQNLTGQAFNGLFDALQKQYIVAASQAEADASIESSLSQMYGQAKGAEESFVQNSIKDMTGIFEWFQSMHGQLLSAQTAAASA